MFKRNMIMVGLLGMGYCAPQAEEGGEAITATTASHGAGADFNPEVHQQSENVLTRADMEAREQAQDETGSVDGELGADGNQGDPGTPGEDGVPDEQVPDNEVADNTTEQESEGTGFMYDGVEVEVQNSPEMVESFKEKGLDINLVNQELYSKEGLTDETRAKLDEAFGKGAVSMYLDGMEAKNKAFVAEYNAGVEKADKATQAIVTEIVGDKMDAVMEWADKNLKSADYEKYREAINSGDDFTMKVALENLANASGLISGGEPETPIETARETAITASNAVVDQSETMLSNKQYLDLFVPGGDGKAPYWVDPAKYDAMRNLGRDNGI